MPTENRNGPRPLSGRRAQAARNDEVILASARAVFIADPGAPITAVAKHAGVGISALYSRYASKEELLRTVCSAGLQRFVDETEASLSDAREPWEAFCDYMRRLVEADTSSLTVALAGSFTPTPEMFALAERSNRLLAELFERFAPVLRAGVAVHDLSLILELVAGVRVSGPARNAELRQRYLTIMLDGLRARTPGALPAPAPSWEEVTARWNG